MSLDDERIKFYLKHRDQIEQWAALRGEAAAAIDGWMVELQDDVVQLASTLGGDVKVHALIGDTQQWPSYRLVSAAWGMADTTDPPACIALEWPRARINMRRPSAPYVGVRAPKQHALATKLRTDDALRAVRQKRKDESPTPWWVAYRYIEAGPEFPESPDGYRDTLLSALGAVWQDYAPFVTLHAKSL